ncbi:epoxide hydrolase [Meredithblackwellia eburnea MCA 4105]
MASQGIKAVIFDIGGVVVGSPLTGINIYENTHNLPPDYLNAAITARGKNGAFQRLERGELALDDFYQIFGEELSDVEVGNKAYRDHCSKKGKECPKLPEKLSIDGANLWGIMMGPATTPDPKVVTAINNLRISNRFKIGALTNNFKVPSAKPSAPLLASSSGTTTKRAPPQIITSEQLNEAAEQARQNPQSAGAPTELLKLMFDEFVESAVVGMRKPDPRFYQYVLDKLGVQPHEAIFLDDIGHNLVAAKKLGMHTIRVQPNRSHEAVYQLELLTGLNLTKSVGQSKL